MELQLKITGVILIVLSLIHCIFPRYFNWKKDLQSLSLINKQMMEVHTFFVAFMVFLMGLLCLLNTKEIMTTPLGHTIALGLSIFWSVRFIFQFVVYSPQLWRGKPFETIIHILFSLLWIYLTILFFLIFKNG
jgi:hypothetical protein